MQRSIMHTTQNYERWDDIAYKYYGDPYLYHPIMKANPHIKISGYLLPGTKVNIPVLTQHDLVAQTNDMPPWMKK